MAGTADKEKPGNARKERLSAALRANLKRRKDQARVRQADGSSGVQDGPTAEKDDNRDGH